MNVSLLRLALSAVMVGSLFAPVSSVMAASEKSVCKNSAQANTGKNKAACKSNASVAKTPKAKTKTVKATSKSTPTRAQAPGGGNSKVWANTSSKNYHCPGAKYYGKTRVGEYMAESDAKAQGYRGKLCSASASKT